MFVTSYAAPFFTSLGSIPKDSLWHHPRGSIDDMQKVIVLSGGKLEWTDDLEIVANLILEWMNV